MQSAPKLVRVSFCGQPRGRPRLPARRPLSPTAVEEFRGLWAACDYDERSHASVPTGLFLVFWATLRRAQWARTGYDFRINYRAALEAVRFSP